MTPETEFTFFRLEGLVIIQLETGTKNLLFYTRKKKIYSFKTNYNFTKRGILHLQDKFQ